MKTKFVYLRMDVKEGEIDQFAEMVDMNIDEIEAQGYKVEDIQYTVSIDPAIEDCVLNFAMITYTDRTLTKTKCNCGHKTISERAWEARDASGSPRGWGERAAQEGVAWIEAENERKGDGEVPKVPWK